jgi:hypothetical protein
VPPTIPVGIPDRLTAGDTWKWTLSLGDFPPSDGYAITYSFRGPSVLANADVTVTPGTSDYAVVVAKAKTAPLTPGTYSWTCHATKAGERLQAASGVVTVDPDPEAADAGELQPHAEKMLAIIEAALSGRLTSDMQSYQIAGRAITKIPVLELKQLRRQYRSELRGKRNGGKATTTVRLTFGRPC